MGEGLMKEQCGVDGHESRVMTCNMAYLTTISIYEVIMINGIKGTFVSAMHALL